MNTRPNQPFGSSNTGNSQVIAGYFRDPEDAESAIADLTEAGFPKRDIGVALRQHEGKQEGKTSGTEESGWFERFRSMFSDDERVEDDSVLVPVVLLG